MSAFTSNLPDDLLEKLSQKAKELNLPKNELLERALRIYLDQLTRVEYKRSYKRAAIDPDLLELAEEGMEDYLQQIDE